MTRPFDLVIFDCDGVLVDSEQISARTLIAALSGLGVEIDFDYFSANFIGRSFPTVADTIRRTFDVALPADFEAAYRSNLLAAFELELHPTPGVREVLDAVSIPKCVATSSSPQRTARALHLTGLLDCFGEAIFTASEVERGKPAPDLFLHVATRMRASPDRCLVIEDSLPGIEAGLAAGMQVMRYIGGRHLAGGGAKVTPVDAKVRILESWNRLFDIAPGLRQGRGRVWQ